MWWFGPSDPRGLAWPVVAPVPGCGRAGAQKEPAEGRAHETVVEGDLLGRVTGWEGTKGSLLGHCPCSGLKHYCLSAWLRQSHSLLRVQESSELHFAQERVSHPSHHEKASFRGAVR